MNNFEENILNRLLNKYENSILSKKGSTRNIKISLSLKDKELETYRAKNSYDYRELNDAVLKELEKKSFINVHWNKNDDFESLDLNLENVDSLYVYTGRSNPKEELKRIKEIFYKYRLKAVGFVSEFIDANINFINENSTWQKNYFVSASQLDDIIKGLISIVNINKEIKIRDFSIKVYGDSKKFETIKNRIAKIIKDFSLDIESDDVDEILGAYNITKNSTYAMIKNGIVFKLNNYVINLNELKYEYCLSDEMIDNMDILDINATKLITVENLTTFYKLDCQDAVIIYLAGFHNHTKQMLLNKIYNKYPSLKYMHFGDIDAGGFYIFNNLKESTKIPFVPYHMDIDDLKNNSLYTKSLTQNDKIRLNNMLHKSEFYDFKKVIQYMLDNCVKLEQEAFD